VHHNRQRTQAGSNESGEIIGGILIMTAFIAFLMWKRSGKSERSAPLQEHNEQAFWAEREARQPETVDAPSDDQVECPQKDEPSMSG